MGIKRYLGGVVSANPDTPTVSSASGVWTVEEAYQNIGNWPMAVNQIERSLRFNSADTAYLSRTPSVAGNRKTWTWSGWVKKAQVGGSFNIALFSGGTTGGDTGVLNILFTAADKLAVSSSIRNFRLSTAVYRDPSSWYHVLIAVDTTQATENNRIRVYVNGSEVTAFDTINNPTQNADTGVNNTEEHNIGRRAYSPGLYLNGYLTEVNFIDGLALGPEYFGFTDGNGIWQPKPYKGAYGTNGFYLNFSDNSTLDSIGYDYSSSGYALTSKQGTPAVSYQNNVATYAAVSTAFDGIVPAYYTDCVGCSGSSALGVFISKDWGSGVTKTITAFKVVGSLNDGIGFNSNVATTTVKLQGSTDNSTWVDLYTSSALAAGTPYLFVNSGITTSTAYRYHRVSVVENSSPGASHVTVISEVELYEAGNAGLNNWVTNGISVTAGAGNDSMVDTPTNFGTDTGAGGEVRGNYATWNSAAPYTGSFTSNGNLDFANNSGTHRSAIGTIGVSSGKWYWEVSNATNGNIGISSNASSTSSYVGATSVAYGLSYNGVFYNNGSDIGGGFSYTNANVIGVALDMDAGTLVMYKDGASQGTLVSGLTGTWFPATGRDGQTSSSANFGQRPFANAAPSGFKALCTQNLTDPTIADGSTAMNAVLYDGNSTAGHAITGVGFQPDLVWTKGRSDADPNYVHDVLRTVSYRLNTASTDGDLTGLLSSFDSDGFTISSTGTGNNGSGHTYVAWNWKAGGSGTSIAAGSIDGTNPTIASTVSANPTAGFSIVTYTGNNSANQTVAHGLGVAPVFGILKDRDPNSNNDQWQIFHTAAGDKYGYFTTAAFTGTAEFYPTSGSSDTVTIARSSPYATTNESGDRYVMYLFAPVAGYSAFGSYVGNNSSDGPFIFCGFRPRYVLIKRGIAPSGYTGNWKIYDTSRPTPNYNVLETSLHANSANSEATIGTADDIDILSNGFKIRVANTTGDVNASDSTYIYAAFAENPFKISRAR